MPSSSPHLIVDAICSANSPRDAHQLALQALLEAEGFRSALARYHITMERNTAPGYATLRFTQVVKFDLGTLPMGTTTAVIAEVDSGWKSTFNTGAGQVRLILRPTLTRNHNRIVRSDWDVVANWIADVINQEAEAARQSAIKNQRSAKGKAWLEEFMAPLLQPGWRVEVSASSWRTEAISYEILVITRPELSRMDYTCVLRAILPPYGDVPILSSATLSKVPSGRVADLLSLVEP